MSMRAIHFLMLLSLPLAASFAHAALPPGISGAWFNPEQSGHGLTVEILGGDRALVFWHVFDAAGNPVHLYIEGDVVGRRIDGQAWLGRGMRFGSFDPDDHELIPWGTVSLEFADCNNADLRWQASGPAGAGFVDGSMPVTRLTALAGLHCDMDATGPANAGKYDLQYPENLLGSNEWVAAVDPTGHVWATPTRTPSAAYVGPYAAIITGSPATESGLLALTLRINSAVAFDAGSVISTTGVAVTQEDGRSVFRGSFPVFPPGLREDFVFTERTPDPLERSFETSELAGRTFIWEGRSQFFNHDNTLRFLADGSFCIDVELRDGGECIFRGVLGAEEPGLAMFAFTGTAHGSNYVGKGWVEPAPGGGERVALVAIATSGPEQGGGLGVVGVDQ
jgi:hypothetical protein